MRASLEASDEPYRPLLKDKKPIDRFFVGQTPQYDGVPEMGLYETMIDQFGEAFETDFGKTPQNKDCR